MSSESLKIAFVGGGSMAGHHLRALGRVDVAHRVVGVADLDAEQARELAARCGGEGFVSVEAMLAKTKPDIVHVCTPAHRHFEPALAALHAGAHVYVEKPFVETVDEAQRLLELAARSKRLACAGFQQVEDPVFGRLMSRAADLAPVHEVDCRFFFRPARFRLAHATTAMQASQLLDILPHPLYTIVAAFERLAPADADSIRIEFLDASPDRILALLRCGAMRGKLQVSLRERPVDSSLVLVGAGGSCRADFMRGILTGPGNDGTQALEKMLNPLLEGLQLQYRTAFSLAKRLVAGESYPGLSDLLGRLYRAARDGTASPLSPDHIRRVVGLYESIAAEVRRPLSAETGRSAATLAEPTGPTALVTGAGGLLGREICRDLRARGWRVRGLGRTDRSEVTPVDEWVVADLAAGLDPSALGGVDLVVHAAAETRGGFAAHERNSIGATRRLLEAMKRERVGRLIFIGSLAVLQPAGRRDGPLDESSPLASRPETLGPYIWGKCTSERVVAAAGREGSLRCRVIRPAALFDPRDLELPGRLGRRLFGHWHLGLGRPGLPFAACDVITAGRVIGWSARHFDEAPAVLNLIDGRSATRGALFDALRSSGWAGRVIWVPISALALAINAAKAGVALIKRDSSPRVSAWKVLKPRRYDTRLAERLIRSSSTETGPPVAAPRVDTAEARCLPGERR